MKREIGWDEMTRDEASVLTVGTFDGVHRGHQAILEYLNTRAAERGGTSTVVSFDPHPRSIVHGKEVELLTTIDERGDVLATFGLDRLVVVPFTNEFARLSAADYVTDFLVDRVGLTEIVVGYDHRFGRNREGDVDLLRHMGRTHGFDVDLIPAQEVDAGVVSSSRIRHLLREGDVTSAGTLLGRPYSLHGAVEHGEGRGRTIGFPTANIHVDHEHKLIPKLGVYAVRVHRPATGDTHHGMMNIGRRPTFDGMDVTVEVHILDFDDDIYDEVLRVEFLRRLRDEKKFDSAEELAMQLSADEDHCRRVVKTNTFSESEAR